MAIIGLLVSVLVPALQSSRESARRAACTSHLRQLGLALHQFESAHGQLPTGAVSRSYEAVPWTPHNYYRWSALTHLLPFLEEEAVYQMLDLQVPLFAVDFQVTSANRAAVASRVPGFLCPSDSQEAVNPRFGPTNYAACAGTGAGGGTPYETDGLFYINSAVKVAAITDGTSKTIAFSESILGRTPPPETTRDEADPRFVYGFARAVPLTETACQQTALWNFTQPRGFSWANGEYRSALYNHYATPNAPQFDCVSAVLFGDVSRTHSGYGWRTARSWHPGGVNAALADGSVRAWSSSVDLSVWQALSTRAGGDDIHSVR